MLTITNTHSIQFNYANNINLAPLITYLKSVSNPNRMCIAVPCTYLVAMTLAAINSKNLFEGGMHMATGLAFICSQ